MNSPIESIAQNWAEAIAKNIWCNTSVYQTSQNYLLVCVYILKCKVKDFKGSVKKQRFLQQNFGSCASVKRVTLKAMENVITIQTM